MGLPFIQKPASSISFLQLFLFLIWLVVFFVRPLSFSINSRECHRNTFIDIGMAHLMRVSNESGLFDGTILFSSCRMLRFNGFLVFFQFSWLLQLLFFLCDSFECIDPGELYSGEQSASDINPRTDIILGFLLMVLNGISEPILLPPVHKQTLLYPQTFKIIIMQTFVFLFVLILPCFPLGIFLNCITNTESACVQCFPNYFINPTSKECSSLESCHTSSETNCVPCLHKECFRDGQPAKCQDSYYQKFTAEGLVCKTCKTQFCATCNEIGDCNSCVGGYWLSAGECRACPKGCKTCTDTNCTTCMSGYRLSNQTRTCDAAGEFPGMYLDRNFNLARCSQECSYQVYSGAICEHSATNCLECAKGYYPKVLVMIACTPCSPECRTCISATQCTSCHQGVLRYFKCQPSCLDSEYFSNLEGMCKSCDSTCFSCLNDRYNCTSCHDPIQYQLVQLNGSGSCQLRCPAGQYMIPKNVTAYNSRVYVDGITTCASCSSNCLECRNTSMCLRCNGTYNIKQGMCLANCGDGYYSLAVGTTNVCIACEGGCRICIDQFVCLECQQNFGLINSSCIFEYESICSNGKWFNELCIPSCPTNSIASTNSCLCHSSCSKCVYNPNRNLVTCLQCANYSWYEYQGQCVAVCPTGTFSIAGMVVAQSFTLNMCVDRCPEGYKERGTTCVKACGENQYTDIRYCRSPPSLGQFISYDDLYANPSFGTTACSAHCQKCLNSQQCLNCSSTYFLQTQTNQTVCLRSCQTNYYIALTTTYCQPCRESCNSCVSYLLYTRDLNSCSQYCPGSYTYDNTTMSCEHIKKLALSVIGYKQPNDLYSATSELRIRVDFNYNATIDSYQLTGSTLPFTLRQFKLVKTYGRVEVILNSSILKPNSLFTFYVKDGNIINETDFSTVGPANASFALSDYAYDALTQNITLTVVNFYVGIVYSFEYKLSVRSDTDPEVVFMTGYANLSAMGHYPIQFKMPLTNANSGINLTISVWNPFGSFNQSFTLTSRNALHYTSQVGKVQALYDQLSFVTASNYTIITDSLRLVIGQLYVSSPTNSICQLCRNGAKCVFGVCVCPTFYYGVYCSYEGSLWDLVRSIQTKLITFARVESSRRLLATSLSSSQKLDILAIVTAYPDALSQTNLAIAQNILDNFDQVTNMSDATKYITVLTNIYAAGSNLATEILPYVKDKMKLGASMMTSVINSTQFILRSNKIYMRMINSELEYSNILMNQQKPVLNFSMTLWRVTFNYQNLAGNPYSTNKHPYAIQIQPKDNQSSTQYYFDVGDGQHSTINYKLPIVLNPNQTSIYNCIANNTNSPLSNNSCDSKSGFWTELAMVKPDAPPEPSFAMIIYGSLVYAIVLGMCIYSEVKFCRVESSAQKVMNENSGHDVKLGKNVEKDLEVANDRHDKSLKISNLQVEKETKDELFAFPGEMPVDAATQNMSEFGASAHKKPIPVGSTSQIDLTSQSAPNLQNNFTYYHLLPNCLIFPQYMHLLTFFLQLFCCHLAVLSLTATDPGLQFIIPFFFLTTVYYTLLVAFAHCFKQCAKNHCGHFYLLTILALLIIAIAIAELAVDPTGKQFANLGLALAVFVCQIGLKDGIMYFYCRNRNDEKHNLAATLRKYMRWMRLIKFVEAVRSQES